MLQKAAISPVGVSGLSTARHWIRELVDVPYTKSDRSYVRHISPVGVLCATILKARGRAGYVTRKERNHDD